MPGNKFGASNSQHCKIEVALEYTIVDLKPPKVPSLKRDMLFYLPNHSLPRAWLLRYFFTKLL